MPSVHLHYDDYSKMLEFIVEAQAEFPGSLYNVRDLYDRWSNGIVSFDFYTEDDAVFFKLKYGGTYRPHG